MRRLVPTLVVLVLLSGCFGGAERSDWAYDVSQISTLQDEGLTGKGVTIAILDTGIDPGHAALEHLVDGKDANGELIAFRDFLGPGRRVDEAFDDDGHGTHVAGIISARSGGFSDKLVQGVELHGGAPGARLVVARVCSGGTCQGDVLPTAVRWAVDQGANVVSLSLGSNPSAPGLINDAVQGRMEEAVRYAVGRGVLVVASAGNEGNGAQDVASPASIRDVLAVGAMDEDNRVADFSQRGDALANQCRTQLLQQVGRCEPNQKPEIVAPGVGILSTWVDGTYARADGTSQATPFVAAAAALILEGRPPMTDRNDVVDLKRALTQSARDLQGQDKPHDDAAGYGMLQAAVALHQYRS